MAKTAIMERPPTKAQAKGRRVLKFTDEISHTPIYIVGPIGELVTACVLGSGMTKVEYAREAGVSLATIYRRMEDKHVPKKGERWHGGCLRVILGILSVGGIALVAEHE